MGLQPHHPDNHDLSSNWARAPFQPPCHATKRTNREQRKIVKMNDTLSLVEPVKPAVAWVGGKIKLAKKIIGMINEIPHTTYAEPFVGMGGIFLRRNMIPKCEIINDYSVDVANFFRILRHHYLPFVDLLRFLVTSRDEWEKLKAIPPESMTDLQRAVRFLYVQKMAFGGKVTGQNFAIAKGRGARFDITKIVPMLTDIHDRLSSVNIERMHYADFILKYDTPETLFYLDPPYFGCEGMYGPDMFGVEDFEQIADLLSSIKGRFILSINDHPEMRATFKAFKQEAVEIFYGLPGVAIKDKKFGELIIRN